MGKRAIHYDDYDGGTEAGHDEPEQTFCGTEGEFEDHHFTQHSDQVTCKRCLKILAERASKTAIVERHRHVLDWFEIDKMKLDLQHTIYEFNYRFGGSWFLQAHHHDGEEWQRVVWSRGDNFNIANPVQALIALGDCVTKFSAISAGTQFHKALAELLARADDFKHRTNT